MVLSLMERFSKHVNVPLELSDCWIWTGCLQKCSAKGGGGYGKLGGEVGGRKTLLAHRVIYELFIGPIPEGMEIDHICHDPKTCPGGSDCVHRRCVNPDHLKAVPHIDNMHRGNFAKALIATHLRALAQTHCLRGHEFNEKNTWIDKRSRRHCRACSLIRQRMAKARAK
jgi:HNH endonuclease